MPTFLEARQVQGLQRVALDGADQLTIGKDAANDLVLPDATVSRLHAVIERFEAAWVLRDVGSRNGTFVNGERIVGDRVLHKGDEIRLGQSILVFRADARVSTGSSTEAADPAPAVTPKEREVLVALCRPVLAGDLLTQPSTAREIADELFVTEAAVKKHLQRLFRKFGLDDEPERSRRALLANEALRRGAVSLGDLN